MFSKRIYLVVAFFSLFLAFVLVGGVIFVFSNKTLNRPRLLISSTGEVKSVMLTQIEIADDIGERSTGLMNRDYLCDSCGMLFVFEEEEERSFWMKNTRIPLDIIFMDETGKIISVSQDTIPENEELRYESGLPAKYVLEVNAGFTREFDIHPGDSLRIEEMIAIGVDFQKPE